MESVILKYINSQMSEDINDDFIKFLCEKLDEKIEIFLDDINKRIKPKSELISYLKNEIYHSNEYKFSYIDELENKKKERLEFDTNDGNINNIECSKFHIDDFEYINKTNPII